MTGTTGSISLRRRAVLSAMATAVLPGFAAAAAGGEVIRLVIPYPVGGGTDIIGRLLAATGSERLGRAVVPENRGGADGLIGIRVVAQARPDGSVLGISGIGTSVTLALTQKNMPFLMGRDLEPIAHLGAFGNLIVVHTQSPYPDLPALLAAARGRSEPFFCGTPAQGSPSYITLRYLCTAAQVDISSVSYQGHGQILNDLLGGQLDMALLSVPIARAAIEAGQLRALAVTSAERSSVLPDVPTVREGGIDDFDASLWNVLVTAKGAPEPVIEQLNEAANASFASAHAREVLHTAGVEFRPYTVAETRAFVAQEGERWRRITRAAGIEPA
ncbi:Bug family tripartite tricarboxylate transporter substrate binding protein [Verticiella sediminum]|nr:tripartite tricarboxylate transporter substrate binding protein [Verticiella sediminum]